MRPSQSKPMTVFNSGYPTAKKRKPTSAEIMAQERIRRKIDAIRDAQDLGYELLEEWER